MTRPNDVSDFGEAVYEQLAPVADLDEANGWALLILIGALAEMYELMDDLAHSSPAWSKMVDPDACPVEGLPWLGQLIGVSVNTNLSEADQRQQIKDHLGWSRGTLQAVANSIAPFLTGTKSVRIKERDTSPYHFTILTNTDETPPNKTLQDIYANYATFQAFYLAFATFEAYWIVDGRNQILAKIAEFKPAALQFAYSIVHDVWMTKTGNLTVSGNEVTDAMRAANVQGDGRPAESSFGIWEARTNKCINGSFETNTTGWGASGVPVRTASWFKFGGFSYLVDYTPTNNDASSFGPLATGAPGDQVLVSSYVNVLDTVALGITCYVVWYSDAGGTVIIGDTSGTLRYMTPAGVAVTGRFTGTGEARVYSFGTAPAGTQSYRIRVVMGANVGTQRMRYYIDGIQYESGTIPTPYIHTDGAAITRNAGRVQVSSAYISATQGFIVVRIQPGWASTADLFSGSGIFVVSWRDDANNGIDIRYDPTADVWRARRMAAGTPDQATSAAQVFATNDKLLLIAKWDATTVSISVNGSPFVIAASTHIPILASATFDIGDRQDNLTSQFDGNYEWAMLGRGILTDADAATLYALADVEPLYSTLPGAAKITAIIPFDNATFYLPA